MFVGDRIDAKLPTGFVRPLKEPCLVHVQTENSAAWLANLPTGVSQERVLLAPGRDPGI